MKRTINLNRPEQVLNATNLDALLDAYLEDARSRLKAYTVDGYAYKLLHLRRWWAEVGPSKNYELRKRDLTEFNTWLETAIPPTHDAPLSYNSRKDVFRRLQAALGWALDTEILDFDYRTWLPKVHGTAPARTAVELNELGLLLAAALLTMHPTRDRAIVAMLMGTGIRREECSSLRVETTTIYADQSGKTKVQAKEVTGREVHERWVAIDSSVGKYLVEWLDMYGLSAGPLFPGNNNNRPLTGEGLYKVVKSCAALAGLKGKIAGPQDLRRNYVTHIHRAQPGEGYGVLLSKQLGHSKLQMTSQYNLQDVEDIRQKLDSPVKMLDNA